MVPKSIVSVSLRPREATIFAVSVKVSEAVSLEVGVIISKNIDVVSPNEIPIVSVFVMITKSGATSVSAIEISKLSVSLRDFDIKLRLPLSDSEIAKVSELLKAKIFPVKVSWITNTGPTNKSVIVG